MLVALFCFPGAFVAWALVAALGGQVVWRATRPAMESERSVLATLSRASWVVAWAPIMWFVAGPNLPALVLFDIAIAVFAAAFGLHLNQLVRRRSHRAGNPRLLGLLVSVAFIVQAVAIVGVQVSLPAPDLMAAVSAGIFTTLAGAVSGAAGWKLLTDFWSEQDNVVDDALRRTRLGGQQATWTPSGYRWEGRDAAGGWRVLAETARVPAAIRVEVSVPAMGRMVIRKRREGEEGGLEFADPILASTLFVDGVTLEVAERLLGDAHESVLPLVHGREASVEHGVLRVDLAVHEPRDQPWLWIEPVLREALAMADSLTRNTLDEPPGTDEVLQKLEQLSAQSKRQTE